MNLVNSSRADGGVRFACGSTCGRPFWCFGQKKHPAARDPQAAGAGATDSPKPIVRQGPGFTGPLPDFGKQVGRPRHQIGHKQA